MRCWSCKTEQPVDNFHKGSDRCKPCAKIYAAKYRAANREKARASSKASYNKNKDAHLKKVKERHFERKYGLTKFEYELLFVQQNHACAICGKLSGEGFEKLVVDHDHVSGNVRGLLCRLCNTSLGGFRDNKDLLKQAITYLEGL